MYNPVHGLPGKGVKLSEQPKSQNTTASSTKRTVDPLGIRVDTSVGKPVHQPPPQIFPLKSNGGTLKGNLNQRRQGAPRPLQLEVNPSNESSRKDFAIRSSPNDSRTPVIIITPTNDDTPKPQARPRAGRLRRPRLTSSIYSVAPSLHHGSSPWPKSRVFSDAPAVSDEPLPPLRTGGSFRDRDMARRTSMTATVLPTPNRSSGWWNVITSPFATRFSTVNSTQSSNDSDPNEHTPLRESAADIAYGGARAIDEDFEQDASRAGNPDFGPFRNHCIPVTGEASKYYDPRYDFSTPALLPASFSTPDIPQSAQTAGSDSLPFSPDDGEAPILAGGAVQLQESSRKVPTPEIPSRTPPKSSCAAVVEDFAAIQTPTIRSNNIEVRDFAQEDMLSPTSPSPIIETASIGMVQTARSVDADSARTPVPAFKAMSGPDSTQSHQGPPAPAFRLVTIDGAINTDAGKQGTNDGQGSVIIPAGTTPASNRDIASTAPSFPTKNKTSGTTFHHTHTASRDSNDPLMSKEGTRNTQEKKKKKKEKKKKSKQPVSERANTKTKFRWAMGNIFLVGISIVLLMVMILAVVLCMTVAQDDSSIPVESHWLNLTGYPPLPTGISTISQPRTLRETSGCVAPSEMWSCALSKGRQEANRGSRPDFRLSILFNNQTISDTSLTQPTIRRRAFGGASPAAYARAMVGRTLLQARSEVSSIMFSPLPAPPSLQDQTFLGNTTDDADRPYAGEKTPFVISFLPTTVPPNPNAVKRSAESSTAGSNSVSNIPAASVNADGSAAGAELYPFPEAQPLMLFNRGLSTEHYGFYSYFDKSIFLNSQAADQNTNLNNDGGAPRGRANAMCTFSQTRFLLQIWTKSGAPLLPASPPQHGTNAFHIVHGWNGTASAFDFSGPGSFPWPVTISIDRHGGNPEEKGVYCYGMDSNGNIATQEKAIHAEDRGFGGHLVNPAPHAFTAMDLSVDEGKYGGVDGGTGGCLCQWANWQ